VDIEATYLRKTPIEHVLLRPGMYIGSTDAQVCEAWVFDASRGRMVRAQVRAVPGLLKIFDEILVNACDNLQRDPARMTYVAVEIFPGGGGAPPRVTVRNDGRGVPVAVHATEKLYVPELVFGHLLTGSNFGGGKSGDEGSGATTGGQHGYGAKLTNIFSTAFSVRTVDAARGLCYAQEWRANMSQAGAPVIGPCGAGEADSTTVAFSPDLARFGGGDGGGGGALDGGTLALMRRRVVDAAGTLALGAGAAARREGAPPVSVLMDGETLPGATWAAYCALFTPAPAPATASAPRARAGGAAGARAAAAAAAAAPPLTAAALLAAPAALSAGVPPPAAAALLGALQCAAVSERLEVAAGVAGLRLSGEEGAGESLEHYNAPGAFASFVNAMATPRGGTHVALVIELLARRLAEHCQKRLRKLGGGGGGGGGAGGGEGGAEAARGGAAADAIAAALSSATVSPALVKQHLRVAVNARLARPAFDSQSKEQLVSGADGVLAEWLGSVGGSAARGGGGGDAVDAAAAALFPDAFVRAVAEEGGVLVGLAATLAARASSDLSRTVRRASRVGDAKIRAIPKLEDAGWAGGRRAAECTLILTEGDSAKALAVAGLAEVGRDAYGVFPLRGKLLNVRDVPLKDALDNAEVAALMAILGLDLGKTYKGVPPGERGLRYGRVMVMADQDVDGSHIKGLVVNLFHTFWPALVEGSGAGGEQPFLQQFVTPVLKARRGAEERHFFSVRDFEAWRRGEEGRTGKWAVKYYKGLGTSTAAEGRAYFRAIASHTRTFAWGGTADGEGLKMAFCKEKADERKAWLAGAEEGLEMREELRAAEASAARESTAAAATAAAAAAATGGPARGKKGAPPALAPAPAPAPASTIVTFSQFIHNELVDFSLADLARSIPSVLDGLKPSQRKVLHACFLRCSGGAGRGGGAAAAAAAAAGGEGAAEEEEGELEEGGGGAALAAAPAAAPAKRGGGAAAPPPRPPPAAAPRDTEIKVAQLAGYVAEHTAYHHGEASLVSTIVTMAQDFVGSNNLPLLRPLGQFGTRLAGGKDAASARYIYTRLSPFARLLFPAADDAVLAKRVDDGAPVEPLAFLPIIPLSLVNGAAGIGTGWSTSVPPFNPLDVVRCVEAALGAGWGLRSAGAPRTPPPPLPLAPWWRGFSGRSWVEGGGEGAAVVTEGVAEWCAEGGGGGGKRGGGRAPAPAPPPPQPRPEVDVGGALGAPLVGLFAPPAGRAGGGSGDYLEGLLLPVGSEREEERGCGGPPDPASPVVRISELPIGKWTETYKAFLHGLVASGAVKAVREMHTEAAVDFFVTLTPAGLAEVARGAAAAAAAAAAVGVAPAGGGEAGKPAPRRRARRGGGEEEGEAAAPPTPDAWRASLSSFFKLTAATSLRNMHFFDPAGRIKRYGDAWEVLGDFMPLRAAGYLARQSRQTAVLQGSLTRAAEKHRFLEDVVKGRFDVARSSKGALAEALRAAGYGSAAAAPAAPAAEARRETHRGPLASAAAARVIDMVALAGWEAAAAGGGGGSGGGAPPGKDLDHLLNQPLWALTKDNMARSAAGVAALREALREAKKASVENAWSSDLAALKGALLADGSFGQ
jgi:DNA gyrase/topoisomerase IV subunit B